MLYGKRGVSMMTTREVSERGGARARVCVRACEGSEARRVGRRTPHPAHSPSTPPSLPPPHPARPQLSKAAQLARWLVIESKLHPAFRDCLMNFNMRLGGRNDPTTGVSARACRGGGGGWQRVGGWVGGGDGGTGPVARWVVVVGGQAVAGRWGVRHRHRWLTSLKTPFHTCALCSGATRALTASSSSCSSARQTRRARSSRSGAPSSSRWQRSCARTSEEPGGGGGANERLEGQRSARAPAARTCVARPTPRPAPCLCTAPQD